jgi:ribosome maturation factor RimP
LEKKSVKDITRALAEEALVPQGYDVVDVQFKSERGKWYLNIFIDKPGGITLDDCEKATLLLDPLLDANPDIAGKHDYLSLSSPGLDRPLKTDADLRRNLGRVLDVKLFSPVDKKKEYTGTLESFDEQSIRLRISDAREPLEFRRVNVARAVQHIEF